MKYVITGASGFLGRALVAKLASDGHEVLSLSRSLSANSAPASASWLFYDMMNPFDWKKALAGADVVYHLAWSTLPNTSNDDPVADAQNIAGTIRLLDAMKGGKARLIFVSSGGVIYGNSDRCPAGEDTLKRPLCAYGVSKLAAEAYCGFYRRYAGFDTVSLRIANLYGPGQNFRSNFGAITNFTVRALRGETIHIWGDGEAVRDYLHIDDAVAALVAAGQRPVEADALNIGTGVGISLNTIVAHLRALLGDVAAVYEPPRGFDVPYSVLDITRASGELGWVPRVEFQNGLRSLVDFLRLAARS